MPLGNVLLIVAIEIDNLQIMTPGIRIDHNPRLGRISARVSRVSMPDKLAISACYQARIGVARNQERGRTLVSISAPIHGAHRPGAREVAPRLVRIKPARTGIST
jgi:hypothetical protein